MPEQTDPENGVSIPDLGAAMQAATEGIEPQSRLQEIVAEDPAVAAEKLVDRSLPAAGETHPNTAQAYGELAMHGVEATKTQVETLSGLMEVRDKAKAAYSEALSAQEHVEQQAREEVAQAAQNLQTAQDAVVDFLTKEKQAPVVADAAEPANTPPDRDIVKFAGPVDESLLRNPLPGETPEATPVSDPAAAEADVTGQLNLHDELQQTDAQAAAPAPDRTVEAPPAGGEA